MNAMEGKIAIVTGASKGIGLATAEKFTKAGAITYFVSRSGSQAQVNSLKKNGFQCYSSKCDITKEKKVAAIVKSILKKHKKIDILVNCAGVVKPTKMDSLSLKEWHQIMDANLTSMFIVAKSVLLSMKKQKYGKIVNVSSIAGRDKSKFSGVHYVTAKAGVIGFTRQLSQELGLFGINVNCIAPSQTYTPMLMSVLTPEKEKKLNESIPLGRIANPSEIANVIFFLASDDASYMTGSIVDVNGGQF